MDLLAYPRSECEVFVICEACGLFRIGCEVVKTCDQEIEGRTTTLVVVLTIEVVGVHWSKALCCLVGKITFSG